VLTTIRDFNRGESLQSFPVDVIQHMLTVVLRGQIELTALGFWASQPERPSVFAEALGRRAMAVWPAAVEAAVERIVDASPSPVGMRRCESHMSCVVCLQGFGVGKPAAIICGNGHAVCAWCAPQLEHARSCDRVQCVCPLCKGLSAWMTVVMVVGRAAGRPLLGVVQELKVVEGGRGPGSAWKQRLEAYECERLDDVALGRVMSAVAQHARGGEHEWWREVAKSFLRHCGGGIVHGVSCEQDWLRVAWARRLGRGAQRDLEVVLGHAHHGVAQLLHEKDGEPELGPRVADVVFRELVRRAKGGQL